MIRVYGSGNRVGYHLISCSQKKIETSPIPGPIHVRFRVHALHMSRALGIHLFKTFVSSQTKKLIAFSWYGLLGPYKKAVVLTRKHLTCYSTFMYSEKPNTTDFRFNKKKLLLTLKNTSRVHIQLYLPVYTSKENQCFMTKNLHN